MDSDQMTSSEASSLDRQRFQIRVNTGKTIICLKNPKKQQQKTSNKTISIPLVTDLFFFFVSLGDDS